MSTFKFLSGANTTDYTIRLRRYHKRLLNRYCEVFNLNPGQPNYHAGYLIFNTVNHFINEGQLTSYDEIRRYYAIAYRHLSNMDDIIEDFEHSAFMYLVNYPEQTDNI
jgi:hypothetical protein